MQPRVVVVVTDRLPARGTVAEKSDGPMADGARSPAFTRIGTPPSAPSAPSGAGPTRATMVSRPSITRRASRQGTAPMAKIQESGERVAANVERVIVGKHQEGRLAR